MKWIWQRCARQRREISLLAGGALDAEATTTLRRHLETCAECRRYYEEVQALTRHLRQLGQAQAEPTANLRRRWTRAVKETARQPRGGEWVEAAVSWCRTWLVRHRRGLTALAPVWLLICFFRLTAPETPGVAGPLPAAPRQILNTLKSQAQVLATLGDLGGPSASGPAPTTPRPRSEIRGRIGV